MIDLNSKARALFQEAHDILQSQGDKNWIIGIENALKELDAGNTDGAGSIYRSMVAGGRGFSEYNIWIDEYQNRLEVNERLDQIKDELWRIFK
ncbi:hypothetical protein I6G65_20145 (plasmid) [Sphingomonas paucimobilis]|uniref:DNA, contig: SP662 n=1 Tax=Sphingomonas paucimobilis NBRC 13935 TaxID=1219050 RepID=A0A0C9M5S2_SPHPI|nr:hypothetical protein [Sphingomonas paucimobilis]QPS18476.1 hypothetical protein I6G65_20145 [Sphingomonas paucimobilis]GAN15645.1 hypothetical protein SP6_62_00220 [Sphingomonas paucimobilis NBRC 13935]